MQVNRAAQSLPTPPANHSIPQRARSSVSSGRTGESANRSDGTVHGGILIVNADDWGRDHETTDRTLECVSHGAVSSVSAMVFMEDSERAASIVRERGIDAGLHLNFTTPFSSPRCTAQLAQRQHELAKCLLWNRFAQTLFYPALMRSFAY